MSIKAGRLAALAALFPFVFTPGARGDDPQPADLNVRIVGTASFQGRQTALIEDLNTRSDSFYKVGDPIYGYEITAISADGIRLQKNGKPAWLAFDVKEESKAKDAVASTAPTLGDQQVAMNTYLPEKSAAQPNFYTEVPKTTTRWDLFTPPAPPSARKHPAIAGAEGESAVASAAPTVAAGRFAMPIASFKRLSSLFGYRKHPIGGETKMHKGIDLAADRGTRILAADNGVVTFAGWRGGFGYCVIINHNNGYETLYGHCSKLIADVGDNVRTGDLIAEVGSTGASTGNHLHFEVHKNKVAINPLQFFPNLHQ